jgi:hypothetical protein
MIYGVQQQKNLDKDTFYKTSGWWQQPLLQK